MICVCLSHFAEHESLRACARHGVRERTVSAAQATPVARAAAEPGPPSGGSATGRGAYPHQEETPMADESYTGEAYCVKCKEKREFTGVVVEKNGRRMAQGICPVCNTKVNRILGKA